jgi:hypothetical protein
LFGFEKTKLMNHKKKRQEIKNKKNADNQLQFLCFHFFTNPNLFACNKTVKKDKSFPSRSLFFIFQWPTIKRQKHCISGDEVFVCFVFFFEKKKVDKKAFDKSPIPIMLFIFLLFLISMKKKKRSKKRKRQCR